ncbi:rod shape-determining protein MreD [Macrococcus equipercicus]|uniref:Rod shape-determining protein MreD n=1 Tax=Macrococcus equipercicus TaxID=69967 RepID=A0A9Q9BP06_9STAP|nr:rod shape-determining protein MreD [Macrococcus equipercicus]UTH13066.1 rod shape-determining protein MreD [Macrococcus equipercicus]
MQFVIIPLIALLLFYLDTLINTMMPVMLFGHNFYFTSHLVLLYLLMLTVYKNPTVALILGAFFGLLSDVYLGTIYGLYTFSYIVFIIMMNQLFKVFYKDIEVMIGLLFIFVLLFESVFYVMAIILSGTTMNVFEFLIRHGLPSSLINLLLIVLIFPLVLKTLERTYK